MLYVLIIKRNLWYSLRTFALPIINLVSLSKFTDESFPLFTLIKTGFIKATMIFCERCLTLPCENHSHKYEVQLTIN